MAKAIITAEEHAALPEPLQKEYVAHDDVFRLNVEPVAIKAKDGKDQLYAMEEMHGIKSALAKERTTVADLQKKLKDFEGITDPAAAKRALDELEKWQKDPPDEKIKKQIDATKAQLESTYRNEINVRDAKIKEQGEAILDRDNQISQLNIKHEAKAALAASDCLPEALDMLTDAVLKSCQCKKNTLDDGRVVYRIEVLDQFGNVRITPKGPSTDPMTVAELVTEMKAGKLAFGFKSDHAAGSGSSGSGSSRMGSQDLSKLPPIERLKRFRQQQTAGR